LGLSLKDLIVKVKREKGSEPHLLRLTQFKESDLFLSIFGKMIVNIGKRLRNASALHLYQIKSSSSPYLRAFEIPLTFANFSSQVIIITIIMHIIMMNTITTNTNTNTNTICISLSIIHHNL
jgi:hypothetical protein